MRAETRWVLVVGAGLVVGLILVLCVALVLAVTGLTTGGRLFGFVAPDIRYKTLTAEEMEHEEREEHPPYTDETIKRAITQGVDPAGNPVEWPMSCWTMSEEDLDDLLEFLKSLD